MTKRNESTAIIPLRIPTRTPCDRIIGPTADALCNCGYILPSAGYIDPADHAPDCRYRLRLNGRRQLTTTQEPQA